MPPAALSPPARLRRLAGALLVAPLRAPIRVGMWVGHGIFVAVEWVRPRHHHPVLAVVAVVVGIATTSGAHTAAIAGEGPEPDLRLHRGAEALSVELPRPLVDARHVTTLTTTTAAAPAPEPTPTTAAPADVHVAAAAAPAEARRLGSPLDRWPHPGPITGIYGEHRGSHQHSGLDLDGDTGDTIWTAGRGRVVATGYLAEYGGYGLVVLVDHGPIETLYTHLSAITVEPGQILTSGTAIGAMGTTGNTTGSHLHFEVRQGGTPLDPVAWLPAR